MDDTVFMFAAVLFGVVLYLLFFAAVYDVFEREETRRKLQP